MNRQTTSKATIGISSRSTGISSETEGTQPPMQNGLIMWRSCRTGLAMVLHTLAFVLALSQAMAQGTQYAWTPISDSVLRELKAGGKTLAYPGTGTSGISVDPQTGDVRLVVPGQGIWLSTNSGRTFTRWDDGNISGNCETGFSLNADPKGNRLACFMLDGPSGMTLDNGKTWIKFAQHGRGWDCGAVNWTQEKPTELLALAHESGGELYKSTDAGESWQLVGSGFTAIGIFDTYSYLASKGDGILRSTDGGKTWTKVSGISPAGRVMTVYDKVGYWVTEYGLLSTNSRGLIWRVQGAPIQLAYGPYFGKDAKQIAVVGKQGDIEGVWRTADAGATWKLAAPFPLVAGGPRPDWTPSKYWGAGWYYNFGWDWKQNILYTSRITLPAFKIKAQ